jgi:hypothetical protein
VNGAANGAKNWDTATPFTSASFFPTALATEESSSGALTADVSIEVSNPGESITPPGWDQSKDLFYELTITPVAKMVAGGSTGATQSTSVGRGRIVVGPARPMRALTKPVSP